MSYDHDTMNTQLLKGKPAEQAVQRFLLDKDFNAIPVMDIKEYQCDDIDFLVSHFYDKSKKDFSLEVKGDYKMADTNNFCLEMISGDRAGFFVTSKADWLGIVDMHNSYLYLMRFDELRQFVKTWTINMRYVKYYTYTDDGRREWYKESWLLRICDAEKHLKSFNKYKIKVGA